MNAPVRPVVAETTVTGGKRDSAVRYVNGTA